MNGRILFLNMLQITSCIMNSSKSFRLRISHLPPSYKLYTQQGYVTFCRCQCGQCTTEHLSSALEYRCCWEVLQARRQLVFDGSIERIKCVTQHEDYLAMTNTAVLKQVGPLLRDKNGKTYRRQAGQSENE